MNIVFLSNLVSNVLVWMKNWRKFKTKKLPPNIPNHSSVLNYRQSAETSSIEMEEVSDEEKKRGSFLKDLAGIPDYNVNDHPAWSICKQYASMLDRYYFINTKRPSKVKVELNSDKTGLILLSEDFYLFGIDFTFDIDKVKIGLTEVDCKNLSKGIDSYLKRMDYIQAKLQTAKNKLNE